MIPNPTKAGLNVGQEFQHGPTFFPGGVFPTQQYKNDMEEWWRVGIRLLRQGGNNANFQPAVELQHTAIQMEIARGFDVHYVVQGPFGSHPSDYTNYYENYMLPDALWAQNAGVQSIALGNELENGTTNGTAGRDIIASMTRTSGVVVITLLTKHNYETGDVFIYYSIPTLGLSGPTVIGVTTNTARAITKIDDFSFSFVNAGTDATTTIGYIQDTNSTVFKRMKRYATRAKADGIFIPMWYSCLQGLDSAQHNHFNITTFAALGKGDFAGLAVNSYGANNFPALSGISGIYQSFIDEVTAALALLTPSTFMVTEWNLGASNTTNVSTDRLINIEYMMKRQRLLNALKIRHYHFCWRFPSSRLQLKNDIAFNIFQQRSYLQSRIDDAKTFNDWWWYMTGQRPKAVTVGAAYINANIRLIGQNRTLPYTPRWSGIAMNYGQDEQSGVFNVAKATARFIELKNLGITKLCIGGTSPSFPAGIAAQRSAALLAKSMGFYIVWIISGSALTDANWPTQLSFIYTQSAQAYADGLDEVSIGNEYEYYETDAPHALTDSVAKIKAAGHEVVTNYFPVPGRVSYRMAQSSMEYVGAPNGWIATGRGDLVLGYNGYGDDGDFEQFKQRLTDLITAFGTNVYVSEWNLNNNYSHFPTSLYTQGQLLLQRLQFIAASGIQTAYFFTYSWESQGNQFALHNSDGTFKTSWLNALFIPKTRTRTIGRTHTSGRTPTS